MVLRNIFDVVPHQLTVSLYKLATKRQGRDIVGKLSG
jgi:hypothetical protein